MRTVIGLWIATGLGTSIPSDLEAASFQGLGSFGGQSQAFGVSDDGTVVVGSSALPGHLRYRAFRWTSATGMVPLDSLSPTSAYAAAFGISGDGSTIVGMVEGTIGNDRSLVRWQGTEGPFVLDDLAGAPEWENAKFAGGASFDGSVIVGESLAQAFRWDAVNGTVGLGVLSGSPSSFSSANATNDDGSVIVGGVTTETGTQPFRWDADLGLVGLGAFQGAALGGSAQAVSADGSIVVGSSLSATSMTRAFRWDALHGMVELGELPAGWDTSAALGLSADGSISVGFIGRGDTGDFLSQRAASWDAAGQVHQLDVLLRAMGLDLTGWTLLSARDVSADGRTIVGTAINPSGEIEGWIAVIPEPGTAVLIAVGLTLLGALRMHTE